MFKKIILGFIILLSIIFCFIAWGLYLMEIEDHYGDLQQVYFDSKSGDLLVNNKNKKFGIVSKNWKRAAVITKEKDTLDLYDFVNTKDNFELLRTENELKINELSFEKILDLKKKSLIEVISIN